MVEKESRELVSELLRAMGLSDIYFKDIGMLSRATNEVLKKNPDIRIDAEVDEVFYDIDGFLHETNYIIKLEQHGIQ
jgi:hypothetical protein